MSSTSEANFNRCCWRVYLLKQQKKQTKYTWADTFRHWFNHVISENPTPQPTGNFSLVYVCMFVWHFEVKSFSLARKKQFKHGIWDRLPCLGYCIVPSAEFGAGWILMQGCFSGVGLGPSLLVKGTLNASAYEELFGQFHCPNFVRTVWGWALPVPTWLHTSVKSQVHKDV